MHKKKTWNFYKTKMNFFQKLKNNENKPSLWKYRIKIFFFFVCVSEYGSCSLLNKLTNQNTNGFIKKDESLNFNLRSSKKEGFLGFSLF